MCWICGVLFVFSPREIITKDEAENRHPVWRLQMCSYKQQDFWGLFGCYNEIYLVMIMLLQGSWNINSISFFFFDTMGNLTDSTIIRDHENCSAPFMNVYILIRTTIFKLNFELFPSPLQFFPRSGIPYYQECGEVQFFIILQG